MGTVGKAISLLEIFSLERAELGLTELAQLAGFDKATTRRLLVELMEHGLVQQDEVSRLYSLGAALVRLARVRETHFPFVELAIPIVARLAEETGETVHLSEYSARGLASIHVEESTRANRVHVPVGQPLPFHATASGLAFIAFADRRLRERALTKPLAAYTPYTVTYPAGFAEMIAQVRARGFSIGSQGIEEGVCSVAAPVIGAEGVAVGALAVASPLVRVKQVDGSDHGLAVMEAARQISERVGGKAIARKRA